VKQKKADRFSGFKATFRVLFTLYATVILFFLLHRLLQLFLHADQVNGDNRRYLLFGFFNRGLLFDTVTATYLLIMPSLLIITVYLRGRSSRLLHIITTGFLLLALCLALAVSLTDIPFYSYYHARINFSVLSWTDDLPLMMEAVFGNVLYVVVLLVFILLLLICGRFITGWTRRQLKAVEAQHETGILKKIAWTAVLLFLLFLGLRGDVDPSGTPLQVKHVFESPSPFVNQLAINPVFNFLRTYKDFNVDYLEDSVAVRNVRQYLGIRAGYQSPVARDIVFKDPPDRKNVVLILMESLHTGRMRRFGNTGNLTPVLDSLANHGLIFENAYTAGIHTYNGVFSSLFSLPALMQNKPTLSSESSGQAYAGLSNVLKKEGYSTVFFLTGSRDFDNFSGVFPYNGIDMMVDEKHYPPGSVLNNWGVGDHTMFRYSHKVLDSLDALHRPFLAVYMTVSTHTPYTVPEDIPFKPTAKNDCDRSYQYADWALGEFMEQAARSKWFHHTLFVLIADHGQVFKPLYDLTLSYHHTPLIFYCPETIQASVEQKLSLQIDVFPTIMGMLRIPYRNNTLGIDLMRESRPFAYFSADRKLGVLNQQYYLIIDQGGHESLYRYRAHSLLNEIDRHPVLADSMKTYAFSMLQTMQFMLRKRLTGL